MTVGVRSLVVAVAVVGTVVAGCGDDGGGQGTAPEPTVTLASTSTTAPAAVPSVSFTEPADGATVASPVKVKMQATNFTIEPAGEVKPGAGHFHITVDDGCVTPGQVIPMDDKHLHYGKAQTEAELMLSPGSHNLCLQVGDGAHTALDLSETISVTVSG
jgi:hypothetical protein